MGGKNVAQAGQPLSLSRAEELEALFTARGPRRFPQCKNRCSRKHPFLVMPPERPDRPPENYNQKVVRTLVPYSELKQRGLAS